MKILNRKESEKLKNISTHFINQKKKTLMLILGGSYIDIFLCYIQKDEYYFIKIGCDILSIT